MNYKTVFVVDQTITSSAKVVPLTSKKFGDVFIHSDIVDVLKWERAKPEESLRRDEEALIEGMINWTYDLVFGTSGKIPVPSLDRL